MKKKIEKKFIINSSEWSKNSVSIVEANQTQQTIILGFYEKSNLSDYALCVCRLSPLLGTPERISEFFFDFPSLDIALNQKIYVVFSNTDSEPSLDEEQNILLSKKSLYPFTLKEDEAIGLLRKDSEGVWKLIDWSKPIIDEVIPLELLQEVSQLNVEPQADFYKSKKIQPAVAPQEIQKKDYSSLFEKPLVWLMIFIVTISLFEIASLLSLKDTLLFNSIKISTILLKNIFTGLLLFKFIRSGFQFSFSIILLFLLSVAGYVLAYYLFSIEIFIGSALLILIISIYSWLTRKLK